MAIEWMTLLPLAAALLVTGCIAGVLAGLLGVGGGIVIVPVLYHLFSSLNVPETVVMHLAVGTSLMTIVPTSISSARAHRRRGAIDGTLLRNWGPWIALGVIIGTVIGGTVSGRVLTAVFAVIALIVAANMAFGAKPASGPASSKAAVQPPPPPPYGWGLGSGIGVFSVMMGIGGGTLSVPILSAFGYPIRNAVASASVIGLIIAIPGALGYIWFGLDTAGRPPLSLGYVNLIGVALIIPATIVTAPWGAAIAHSINPVLLKRLFALFLFLTALRMGWDFLGL